MLAVFADGITGGTSERAAFLDLLTFLDQRRAERPGGTLPVLVDDIKRFAREVEVHFDLKAEIVRRGGRLESPGFRFEDTPEGKFLETIFAAQAELERNQNRRQVMNRTRARLEQGYWTFRAPPGYVYKYDRVHKRLMVRDGDRAEMVREALEGYAAGKFVTQADVGRYLAARGFWPPGAFAGRPYGCLNQVGDILRNVLYAGHLEHAPWGVTLRRAQHEALIPLETFERIRVRLAAPRRATLSSSPAARPDRHGDFVLRGFVACARCGTPLTASWTRGGSGRRYPYYHCYGAGCPLRGKGIARERLEGEFAALLGNLTATPTLLDAMRRVLILEAARDEERRTQTEGATRTRLAELERATTGLADRLALVESDAAARSLERRIAELERERVVVVASLDQAKRQQSVDVGTAFDRIRHLLENPLGVWVTGDFEARRIALRLVLDGPLLYARSEGLGTPRFALPYSVLAQVRHGKSSLVDVPPDVWNLFGITIRQWAEALG